MATHGLRDGVSDVSDVRTWYLNAGQFVPCSQKEGT